MDGKRAPAPCGHDGEIVYTSRAGGDHVKCLTPGCTGVPKGRCVCPASSGEFETYSPWMGRTAIYCTDCGCRRGT